MQSILLTVYDRISMRKCKMLDLHITNIELNGTVLFCRDRLYDKTVGIIVGDNEMWIAGSGEKLWNINNVELHLELRDG